MDVDSQGRAGGKGGKKPALDANGNPKKKRASPKKKKPTMDELRKLPAWHQAAFTVGVTKDLSVQLKHFAQLHQHAMNKINARNAKRRKEGKPELPYTEEVDENFIGDPLKLNHSQLQAIIHWVIMTQRFYPQQFLKIAGKLVKLEPLGGNQTMVD